MAALLFVGSSSVEPASPLPRFVASRLGGRSYEAAGIRGSRVSTWAHRVERGQLPDVRARELVIVHLGGNDATAPDPRDIRAINDALAAGGAPVLWLPPPRFPRTSTDASGRPMAGRRERMEAALRAAAVRYVRAAPGVGPHFARDGIHPTRAGYERWAAAVAPELRRALEVRGPAAELGTPKASRWPFLLILGAIASVYLKDQG